MKYTLKVVVNTEFNETAEDVRELIEEGLRDCALYGTVTILSEDE